MGALWQTPDQKVFIGSYLPSYSQHVKDKTLKSFWPNFFDKWFQLWPLPEPDVDAVGGETARQDMLKADRVKKINVSASRVLITLA